MKTVIIGTAGHIDHGKTTLVRALTGIDTDRLKEEKQRGISIELGFAPLTLPGGQKAAIVDVPGHERFIKNMLAGASGIDMVMFTIAADEGIMPQTREHMDIIELLGVDTGVVVITKKDLVDAEWLKLVEEDIKAFLNTTVLKNAPIIAVSAVSGEGIPELLDIITELVTAVKEKSTEGQARLPIDRVFTISGFGTVVTGTLWSGQINAGDILELIPVQRRLKVRNVQVHNQKVAAAHAGQRVAVNLQGIEVGEIERGYWLAAPGYLHPSYRVDARLRLLASSSHRLKNWNRVRFHIGTDEAMGRVLLLDRDELLPGEEALVQIVLEKPVAGCKNDRFIIRYYSPVTTIGGGTIIDPAALKQKRFNEKRLTELAIKEEGDLYAVILQELQSDPLNMAAAGELAQRIGSTAEKVEAELQQLLADKKVIDLTGRGKEYLSSYGLNLIIEQMKATLIKYHQAYPLRLGYPREDMRSRWFKKLTAKEFNLVLKYLEEMNIIASKSNFILLPGYVPAPAVEQQDIIKDIMKLMDKQLFNPPTVDELEQLAGIPEQQFSEIFSYLLDQGSLIKLNENLYFSIHAIEKGKNILEEYFRQAKELTLATARDLFATSRKYALSLLEYYDKIHFTHRVGDVRKKGR